jgi:uroporphyrinogen decarboxylase
LSKSYFVTPVFPNWHALVDTILRKKQSDRVHHIELFLDPEVQAAVCDRFSLLGNLQQNDPFFDLKRHVAIQRFLGYDYVRCSIDDFDMPIKLISAEDSAELQRNGGRDYVDEHIGPITSWEDFEKYPWPDVSSMSTRSFEFWQKNLPDDMCVIAHGGFAHFAEYISWLMGYETLCYALFEKRDLVTAISQKLVDIFENMLKLILEFDRVKIVWGSDDMGFRGGPMISPDDLREFVLPGHKLMAQMAHDAGRPYLLHSCGKLDTIIEDLIEDVRIDARHSFEDTIERVTSLHKKYGHRIAHLGGIDVDFLCRSDEAAVRKRVRETLDACLPLGGYCLGTGNSVANYIPLDNYLAMLDEGRNYQP